MLKFYRKDQPKELASHSWIGRQCGLTQNNGELTPEFNKFPIKNNFKDFIKFKNDLVDIEQMQTSVDHAFDKFGWFGFMGQEGVNQFVRSNYYGGLGLTYNKNYFFNDQQIPKVAQVFGYPRANGNTKFVSEEKELMIQMMERKLDQTWISINGTSGTYAGFDFLLDNQLINKEQHKKFKNIYENIITDTWGGIKKDTYHDAWGFCSSSDVLNFEYFNDVKKLFKRSLIRSRVAGFRNVTQDNIEHVNHFMWHRDTNWFVELRINLIVYAPRGSFGIEVKDVGKTYYETGDWASWDTNIIHRPFVEKEGIERVNLIFGINPWFDYNPVDDSWTTNEFYKKKHPMDMLIDGDILEGLQVIS